MSTALSTDLKTFEPVHVQDAPHVTSAGSRFHTSTVIPIMCSEIWKPITFGVTVLGLLG